MRWFVVFVFALSGFAAGAPVLAQPAPGGADPHWVKQPSPEDVVAVFPRSAARLGHSGRVRLKCAVQADGSLSRCDVLSEDPGDEGFADAALKLSKRYRLAPSDGSAAPRTTIVVPIEFPLAP